MAALTATPVLETARLTLRAPVADDWPGWRDFFASDRARFVGGPMTQPGQSWRAFGHFIGHWVLRGYGMFVLVERDTGLTLGAVGPWFPDGWPEQEIGWTLWRPEAEGKGFAHEAALAARAFAFDRLGWSTAVSYIAPDNAASIALAERLGASPDPRAAIPVFSTGPEPTVVYRHPREDA